MRGKSLTMDIYELIGKYEDISETRFDFIKTYETALNHYFDQDFTRALSLFEQASQKDIIHDKTCEVFIDRCKYFIRTGSPGSNWDGVFSDEWKG